MENNLNQELASDSEGCCGGCDCLPKSVGGDFWNNPVSRRRFLKNAGGATAATMLALHGMKVEVLGQGVGSNGYNMCTQKKTSTATMTGDGYASEQAPAVGAEVHWNEWNGNKTWDKNEYEYIPLPCQPLSPITVVYDDPQLTVEGYLDIEGWRYRYTVTQTKTTTYCNPIT